MGVNGVEHAKRYNVKDYYEKFIDILRKED